MLFNSFSFAIFLPIVFSLYWLIPARFRWFLLFVSSYYFYMSWNPKYVVLILLTTVVSFVAAILIEKKSNVNQKKLILFFALIISLGVLFFFKYFNFFSESVVSVLSAFSLKVNPITLKLMLPVGISFYTFQTLGYVIDVYRGNVKAEKHFGYYATFISFFPQLVAGPIERTGNLLNQIKAEHKFDYERATYGVKLMAWGFFKKIAVADVLAQYVSSIYDSPQNYQGFSLLVATVFFAFQIYCDFSGYSDIAIGTSELFGIKLMTNFKSPYFSESIKEFWSRWHISLSTWFKDYVYIPLGGNRVSKTRHSLNLLITFLVSGLWHGANWTFVIWGALHGFAQIIENLIIGKKRSSKNVIERWLRVAFVFAFCVFAWVFFVSSSLDDAIYVITNMFAGIGDPINYIITGYKQFGINKIEIIIIFINVTTLILYDYISLKKDVISCLSKKPKFIRWVVYILLVIWIIFNIPSNAEHEFIYFQF